MSRQPPTFGEVSNLTEEYQPPSVNAWTPSQQLDDDVLDDEPFTIAHLSAEATVPAAAPPPSNPFTQSVAPPREVSGRIGPSASTAPPPAPVTASLLGGNNTSSAGLGAGNNNNNDALGGGPDLEDPRSYPFYNIKRYRTYFNVDTNDVLQRIFRALVFFFKGDFLEYIETNPDLYGPFWIASSLVFVSAAAGNYASYIAFNRSHAGEEEEHSGWYYDVDKVGISISLFYGYVGIIGFMVWAALRWFQCRVELSQVWCTYGYAMAVYIPMAVLCVLPMEIVRWSLIGGATLVSGLFLLLNFRGPVFEAAGAKASPLLLAIVGLHGALGLALKFYFFHYSS